MMMVLLGRSTTSRSSDPRSRSLRRKKFPPVLLDVVDECRVHVVELLLELLFGGLVDLPKRRHGPLVRARGEGVPVDARLVDQPPKVGQLGDDAHRTDVSKRRGRDGLGDAGDHETARRSDRVDARRGANPGAPQSREHRRCQPIIRHSPARRRHAQHHFVARARGREDQVHHRLQSLRADPHHERARRVRRELPRDGAHVKVGDEAPRSQRRGGLADLRRRYSCDLLLVLLRQ
mmetsp:Transcript_11198/g.45359  ORF Transcript_11198/g.45359 Transcript_11198/m.45359 type:complete len:234 (-) Transcript_11198:100-801(-)